MPSKTYTIALAALGFTAVMSGCTPSVKPKTSAKLPTCTVDLKSEDGGHLEVFSRNLDPRLPISAVLPALQILWHPPTLGSSADLVIAYRKSSLEKLDDLDGGHVRFRPVKGIRPKTYEALATVGSTQIWHFESTDVEVEAGDNPTFADLILSEDRPGGGAVLTAINNGQHIRIALLDEGKQIASATFNPSATAGRDKLLAQARHLIETSDPSVCPKPRSIWPTE